MYISPNSNSFDYRLLHRDVHLVSWVQFLNKFTKILMISLRQRNNIVFSVTSINYRTSRKNVIFRIKHIFYHFHTLNLYTCYTKIPISYILYIKRIIIQIKYLNWQDGYIYNVMHHRKLSIWKFYRSVCYTQ